MNKDFTVDELYKLIEHDTDYPCGYDEVMLLLAEYIGDKKIIEEVEKYVDDFYEDIGLGRRMKGD